VGHLTFDVGWVILKKNVQQAYSVLVPPKHSCKRPLPKEISCTFSELKKACYMEKNIIHTHNPLPPTPYPPLPKKEKDKKNACP